MVNMYILSLLLLDGPSGLTAVPQMNEGVVRFLQRFFAPDVTCYQVPVFA